jgi:hypothetical protein
MENRKGNFKYYAEDYPRQEALAGVSPTSGHLFAAYIRFETWSALPTVVKNTNFGQLYK